MTRIIYLILGLLFFQIVESRAQFNFEHYLVKNHTLLDYLQENPENYIYNKKSCVTDWATGVGVCKDIFGEYKISRKDSLVVIEKYKSKILRRKIYFHSRKEINYMLIYHPKTGGLLAKFSYKNKALWNVEYYYDDGNIKPNGGFLNGNGELIYYRWSGKKKQISNFINGVASGSTTYYYSNGNVFFKGNYKFGRPDGNWFEYNINGREVQNTRMAMGLVVRTRSI